MKRSSLILVILVVGAVSTSGILLSQSNLLKKEKQVEVVESSLTGSDDPSLQDTASSTLAVQVEDSRPECQRIEDTFTGTARDNFQYWSFRVEKYPIAKKYEGVKSYLQENAVGAGNDSVTARLFTAADCGEEQVKRLMGAELSDLAPLAVSFELDHPSPEFLEVLKKSVYSCMNREDFGRRYTTCSLNENTTIQDYADLRFFAEYMKYVEEQG